MKSDPEAWRLAQAAGAALQRRDFATAKQLAQQVMVRQPNDANALQILGLVALEEGDAAAAKRLLERADAAAPNHPHIMNALGTASRRLGEVDAARRLFARAGAAGLADAWRNLGNLESGEQENAAAVSAYQRVLAVSANDAAAHAGLAQGYEALHDLAKAKAHAEAALRLQPGNEIARIALAQVLMREKDFAGAESAAMPLTQSAGTNAALAWGIIGDARDRQGDTHGAFAAYSSGNRLLLAQHSGLLEDSADLYHPASVARISATVAASDVAAWPAGPSSACPTPAFLVGFPRSGTTLLDQVLSSHSGVICVEEQPYFADAVAALLNDPEKLAHLDLVSDAEIEAMRADYWRRLRAGRSMDADALVVDKMPLNVILLPLIRRVFPRAKIIFALRDPRDVILSCYAQRFRVTVAMAQFLDLARAAQYYDAVMRLADLCQEKLGLDVLQVRYEDVVSDLESQARRLAAFLGVAFEPAMLAYRETALKRDINTPSARQVIEPLYDRSIGKWRRYADDLAPVLPLLNAWAERFGYPA